MYEQVGYLRGMSADENLAGLARRVQVGWNKPKSRRRLTKGKLAEKSALLVFDFSHAHGVIDHQMFRLKLPVSGVPRCMTSWVWAFLGD